MARAQLPPDERQPPQVQHREYDRVAATTIDDERFDQRGRSGLCSIHIEEREDLTRVELRTRNIWILRSDLDGAVHWDRPQHTRSWRDVPAWAQPVLEEIGLAEAVL